jgi:hypothetical protein
MRRLAWVMVLWVAGCTDVADMMLPPGSTAIITPHSDEKLSTPREIAIAEDAGPHKGNPHILNAGTKVLVIEDDVQDQGRADYRDKHYSRWVKIKVQSGDEKGRVCIIRRFDLSPSP